MRTISIWVCVAAVTVALAWDGAALAQLTAAQKCEKLKNKAAGRRALCIAKARAKEIAGKPFNYAACTTAMADAFTKAETNANSACPKHFGRENDPETGDAAAIEARIVRVFDPDNAIPKALSGVRFVDNGDGTVTDTETGLQWEKKVSLDGIANSGNPHDADNMYTWNTTPGGTTPNGTAFAYFLASLNDCSWSGLTLAPTGGFAGHCDWRLPTQAELLSIMDNGVAGCGSGGPCIPAIFGPTTTSLYWSSTTDASVPAAAWVVWFLNGTTFPYNFKNDSLHVRAVRGGL